MDSILNFVTLLCVGLLAVDARAFGQFFPSAAVTRRLLQDDVATGIRVVDFSNLPGNLTAEVEYNVPETQLNGAINISATSSERVSYGTYFLGPEQVRQLNETISAEMVRSSRHHGSEVHLGNVSYDVDIGTN